jgi:DNA repair protein RadD
MARQGAARHGEDLMGFKLRPYQRNCLDHIYNYWRDDGGNCLVCLPTGSGKSLIIASICKELLADYPGMRIGVASHVRELIQQSYDELLALWPEAPAGIYSAGMNRREAGAKILFCGVQSVWNKVPIIGGIDLLLIDEAHLVSHNTETTYRKLIDALKLITPDMRIVGLTATAFRLDTGWLHKGKGAIFDDLVYEINVRNLIEQGYLCKLISKKTATQMDVSKVGKRAGEFITSELEIAVDQDWITKAACKEIVEYGKGRKAWLAFCVTVRHAEHVVERLRELGVSCFAVFGHTPKAQRDILIERFRAGEFTCLVSVMVLGIGFNVPHVDLICLMRPTASGGLFVQQVGRGLRNAEGKKDCLILDFSGNTLRHGPIDLVRGREKNERNPGEKAAAKVCPECDSIVPLGATTCEVCGFVFAKPERKLNLPTADASRDIVSSNKPEWIEIDSVTYREHQKFGQPDAPHTLRVNYHAKFTSYSEWVCFDHPQHSYPHDKAVSWWRGRSRNPHWKTPGSVYEALERKRELIQVQRIQVQPDGKFHRIVKVELKAALAFAPGDDVDIEDDEF